MFLHLGQSTVVFTEDVVGIFDIDGTTTTEITRDYLSKAEKNGNIINVSHELPKSFVVCEDGKVFLSQLMPSTLSARKGSQP